MYPALLTASVVKRRNLKSRLVAGLVWVLMGVSTPPLAQTGHSAAQPYDTLMPAPFMDMVIERMTLTDAVARTLARHPEIARALALVSQGHAELAGARSGWLPQVSYQGQYGPEMSRERATGLNDNLAGPSITLNQLLWDFGRTNRQIDAASAAARQRAFDLESTADALAEQASQAYLDVVRSQQLHLAAQMQIEALQRLRNLLELRTQAGISDHSDLLLADVRIDGARGDALQAETLLATTTASLANFAGVFARHYTDPLPLIRGVDDHTTPIDYEKLPAVAALRANEKSATARIDHARAERWPRIGLQMGYSRNNYTYESRDDSLTATITLSGDLYQPRLQHTVRAARYERLAAQEQVASVIIELRGREWAAREAIRGGLLRVTAHEQQARRATATRDILAEEYKIGKRALPDLLNAEMEIHRAASARINAGADVLRARVQLAAVRGALRPTLGLAPQIDNDKGH